MTAMRIILILVLTLTGAGGLRAEWDPIGLKDASRRLEVTAEKLPSNLQKAVGVSAHQISTELKKRIDQISAEVPVINEDLSGQLNHLADISHSLADELNHVLENGISAINRDLKERIKQLQLLIKNTLKQVDQMVQAWIQETKNAVIQIVDRADKKVTRLVSQILYDGIRYTGIALFMLGLLIVSVKLLDFIGKGFAGSDLQKSKTLTIITGVFLLLYFGTTVTLSISPGALAFRSSTVQEKHTVGPCQTYNGNKSLHIKVKKLKIQTLTRRTNARMDKMNKKCQALLKN